MNETLESFPLAEPFTNDDFDIPWERIVERVEYQDRSWWTPRRYSLSQATQYEANLRPDEHTDWSVIHDLTDAVEVHLEEVILEGGLPYIAIRDRDNNEVFCSAEYHSAKGCSCGKSHDESYWGDIANPIVDAQLSNGFVLESGIANSSEISQSGWIKSIVRKEVDISDSESRHIHHTLKYGITPQTRDFGGRYECLKDSGFISIKLDTNQDGGENSPNNRLSYEIQFQDGAENVVNFYFSPTGALRRIWLQKVDPSEALIDSSMLKVDIGRLPEDISLYDEQLREERVRNLIRVLFQVDYGDVLVLNTKETFQRLITNINSQQPQDPVKCLSFIGATAVEGGMQLLSSIGQ